MTFNQVHYLPRMAQNCSFLPPKPKKFPGLRPWTTLGAYSAPKPPAVKTRFARCVTLNS